MGTFDEELIKAMSSSFDFGSIFFHNKNGPTNMSTTKPLDGISKIPNVKLLTKWESSARKYDSFLTTDNKRYQWVAWCIHAL